MADITLNSAVRSNLRTLQATTELMSRTEERLSTGKKVNSALDNPTNFFTAQSLERRAGDLSSLLDSVSNSVQTLEAADNGISAITDLVEQMKSTARSAQQSSSAVSARASATSDLSGLTADNLLGTGSAVAAVKTGTVATLTGATTLDGLGFADGDAITITTASGASTFTVGTATTDDVDDLIAGLNGGTSDVTVDLSAGALRATAGNTTDSITYSGVAAGLTGLGLDTTAEPPTTSAAPLEGKTLSVQVGAGASTTENTKLVTLSATGTNTLEELNAELVGIGAKASITSAGKLTIETLNQNEADSITVGGTSVDLTAATSATSLFDLDATAGAATTDATVDDKRQRVDYMNDYNDLREQIGQLAKDASYNGVNLLAGDDLKVVFNEDGKSKLDISGVDVLDTLGLSDLTEADFMDSASIDTVVQTLTDALDNLDSLSGKFGSQLSVVQTRQDFTKDMVSTLDGGANLLTAADTNEEAANLATLQTRQSLIVSSLSISTQQEQGILQLLR